ncbi:MAG: pyridoxine 5'-phosphate synthase [Bacteroidetes bacterium]|nr:pyridoxine 5'-phosphate synthase [Bacteroidota bacterium]
MPSSIDPYSPLSAPTKLSVNINKIATSRNARGHQIPDLLLAAKRCQSYGAQAITVHPRPDERHIRYQDARDLRAVVHQEYNIEGYPSKNFIQLVLECQPEQVTLVPDGPDVLTSDAGWDCLANETLLTEAIAAFRAANIRVSLFMDCDATQIQAAAALGADRIELYTESYARTYVTDPEKAVLPFVEAGILAHQLGLGLNAGHDLDSENLAYFVEKVPHLLEVSIGHALISDALYLGLENAIQRYRYQCEIGWNRQS